jgi:hypothetical protein
MGRRYSCNFGLYTLNLSYQIKTDDLKHCVAQRKWVVPLWCGVHRGLFSPTRMSTLERHTEKTASLRRGELPLQRQVSLYANGGETQVTICFLGLSITPLCYDELDHHCHPAGRCIKRLHDSFNRPRCYEP